MAAKKKSPDKTPEKSKKASPSAAKLGPLPKAAATEKPKATAKKSSGSEGGVKQSAPKSGKTTAPAAKKPKAEKTKATAKPSPKAVEPSKSAPSAKTSSKTSAKAPSEPKAKASRSPAAKAATKQHSEKAVPSASPAKPEPKTTSKKSATASSSKDAATPKTKPSSGKKSGAASGQLPASFLAKQKQRLLELKDTILDSMNGVARDTLRSRPEGSESSAFGMHQADAGSDSYDRDFALGLISQEQDSLYEIEEALKRIENGTYGICEMSGKPIPVARLEALPFTRYTVECQAEIEKKKRFKARTPVTSLFGLSDDEDSEDEEGMADTKE